MLSTALLVGGAFGVRHAFEADHVAAVAALVGETDRPGSTGVAWGVGHAAPIVALGGAFLALGVGVPDRVAAGFEGLVALVLILLGVRAVVGAPSLGRVVVRHVHGGRERDPDGPDDGDAPGDDSEGHPHVRVLRREVGLTHSHVDRESFGVGVVHGLAGSGGVVVALAATAGSPVDGAAFLAGFAAATVAAMGAASWGLDRAAGRAGAVRALGGVASVLVGLLLLAEVLGVGVPA
ncbi:high-affinity nickel-transporter protein [Halobaculum sp. EA56]|uniref:high-affinity nickel-transporter protein n=1 Tax=Halobaculum sp. EA56 TaxID=3421648 RepID=UPI003EBCDE37